MVSSTLASVEAIVALRQQHIAECLATGDLNALLDVVDAAVDCARGPEVIAALHAHYTSYAQAHLLTLGAHPHLVKELVEYLAANRTAPAPPVISIDVSPGKFRYCDKDKTYITAVYQLTGAADEDLGLAEISANSIEDLQHNIDLMPSLMGSATVCGSLLHDMYTTVVTITRTPRHSR